MVRLQPTKIPVVDLAFTNCAYVNPADFNSLLEERRSSVEDLPTSLRCSLQALIITTKPHPDIAKGAFAVSASTRKTGRIGMDSLYELTPYEQRLSTIGMLTLSYAPIQGSKGTLKDVDVASEFCKMFAGHILVPEQMVTVKLQCGVRMEVKVEGGSMKTHDGRILTGGQIPETFKPGHFDIEFEGNNPGLQIVSSVVRGGKLFDTKHIDFESMGIGGLDNEFQEIFRRAFASRIYPPGVIKELGITHVKGLILHGPAGTGKTLIARQIGKALKSNEPKVVNGPEILNKFVGQSEENVRNLFKEAEEEQQRKGENSSLHIIIFDELDAICKQRGSTSGSTGVNDSVVNQLLSKIDGVDALNNILIIGMTNRLDLMDDALLRPGRFEVHIEIGLPDLHGREQIFRIHTGPMKASGRLARDVDIEGLASGSVNYTGAEIAGVCRSAASFALNRNVDFADLSKPTDISQIEIQREDFTKALDEVHAAFGVEGANFERYMRFGIVGWSREQTEVQDALRMIVKQQLSANALPVTSVLLHGIRGSGKTALACSLAIESKFPFAKLLSAEDMVGMSDGQKISEISKAFADSYKSPKALIIIDEIERIIDYSPVGPRFSNNVLQAIMVLVKKLPPVEGRAVTVIATTSEENFMSEASVDSNFDAAYRVPAVKSVSQIKRLLKSQTVVKLTDTVITEMATELEVFCKRSELPLPVKRLLQALERAVELADGAPVDVRHYAKALRTFNINVAMS